MCGFQNGCDEGVKRGFARREIGRSLVRCNVPLERVNGRRLGSVASKGEGSEGGEVKCGVVWSSAWCGFQCDSVA